MNWIFLHGNWVLCPPEPIAFVHFFGGAFVATAPHLTYNAFLHRLAAEGYGIITPPFLVQPDHWAIAMEVAHSFHRTYQALCPRNQSRRQHLPVFGIGHSLGAKLQILLTCQDMVPRAGNILVSFNNFESDRAIPLIDLLMPWGPLSFSPTPKETWTLIQAHYQQPQTLVLKFNTDTLDESGPLNAILKAKFPDTFIDQALMGDHLTPLDPDRRPITKRLRLESVTLKWLNYQRRLLNSPG